MSQNLMLVLSLFIAPVIFVLMAVWLEYFSPNSGRYLKELRNLRCYKVLERQFKPEHFRDQSIKRNESSDFLGRICVLGKRSAWSLGSVTLVKVRNSHYFITSKHVFTKAYNPHNESLKDLEVFISMQGKRHIFKGCDFFLDRKEDLALVLAPKSFTTDLIFPDTDLLITIGREVTNYSFTMGAFFSSTGKIDNVKKHVIVHTAETYYGSSGGPVVMTLNGQKLLVGITRDSVYGTNVANLRRLFGKFIKQKEVRIVSEALRYKVILEKILNYSRAYHCPIMNPSQRQR